MIGDPQRQQQRQKYPLGEDPVVILETGPEPDAVGLQAAVVGLAGCGYLTGLEEPLLKRYRLHLPGHPPGCLLVQTPGRCCVGRQFPLCRCALPGTR